MTKKNDMHVDEFEYILEKFSHSFWFRQNFCAKKIETFFFFEKWIVFQKISSNSSEKLYDPIIESFDSVIVMGPHGVGAVAPRPRDYVKY